MPPAPTKPGVVWIKTRWGFERNPFPAEAMAVLGGSDDRENGRLFRPEVQTEQFDEAIGKFVLGATYNGQRFGALWSMTTALDPDSRGYGKSVLLQYLSGYLNEDFGRAAFLKVGLDESDAAENPICALLASFDMAATKNLNSLFFSAVEYGTDFRLRDDHPTLYERLYQRLCAVAGTDDMSVLSERCHDAYRALRGRTFGPPEEKFSQPYALVRRGRCRIILTGSHHRSERARVRISSPRCSCSSRLQGSTRSCCSVTS